jgi:hypothetical protein
MAVGVAAIAMLHDLINWTSFIVTPGGHDADSFRAVGRFSTVGNEA